jgi:hypothetical protein
MVLMPRATTLLRLIAFTVPALLLMAGVQPLLAAATGQVTPFWAIQLSAPVIGGAVTLFVTARLMDRGDGVAPPWYSAWVLLPGAFVLTGAAAMSLIGALVQFAGIPPAMWFLLVAGTSLWAAGMVWVRQASR